MFAKKASRVMSTPLLLVVQVHALPYRDTTVLWDRPTLRESRVQLVDTVVVAVSRAQRVRWEHRASCQVQ
jgi:hypothetical protein